MSALINVVLPVFALIFLGFIFVKTKVVPPATADGLSSFVFFAAVPALLFNAVTKGDLLAGTDWRVIASYYSSCLILYVAALLLSTYVFRLKPVERPLFAMGCMFSNTVLLGIPVALATFGSAAEGPIFFIISVHGIIIMPTLICSLEIAKGSRGGLSGLASIMGRILLKVIANPIIMAIVGGALWLLTGLPVPEPVDMFLGFLARAVVPCSLFAVGASLAQHKLGGNMGHSLTSVGFKLVLHPALAWVFAAKVAGLPPVSVGVITLFAAMPAGVNVFLLSTQYGAYVQRAASVILISTIMGVVSLSFLITWLKVPV